MNIKKFRTWINIDKKTIVSNVLQLSSICPIETKFIAVVKGNAYGHGMVETSSALSKMKEVDYLAVFTVDEAIELRKNGILKNILVLKNLSKNEIDLVEKYNLEVCVSSTYSLSSIKYNKIKIHLCVDTGLGRDGFLWSEREKVVLLLKKNKNIKVVGLFTHFSGAEERKFDTYTKKQLSELLLWKKILNENTFNPLVHASATSGAFLGKDFSLDMVRFGIGVYGLWPSGDTKKSAKNIDLKPVLSWYARISEIKKVPKGSFIGYDLTYKTKKDSVLAVVPVGYFDGYSRALSGKVEAIIAGKKVLQVGRVMMNMIVFDVSSVKNVKEGGIVTLIGHDKKNKIEISIDELSEKRGTINYETVTGINPEIPRIVI